MGSSSKLRRVETTTCIDDFTFVSLLKSCTKKRDLDKGTKVHDDILLQKGMLEKSPYLASALINMYAKCGSLSKAERVLGNLPFRDIISWNALISGYAQQGHGEEAIKCLEKMRKDGFSPDVVTFTCILKACSIIRDLEKGMQIHEEVVGRDLLGKDIMLGTALVDMYAKCGMLENAQKVLEELPVRNVVSWSALIAGYAQIGQSDEAMKCFELMQREGLSPNTITFVSLLKACATSGMSKTGKEIHDDILNRGFLGKDIVIGNALVDMYAKCGELIKAQEVLEQLPARNVVSWSALIAGYAEHGQGHEAIDCLQRMQREGLSPNSVTFICILKACGSTRSLEKGKQVHDYIVNRGLLNKDIVLGTALVDMYAKCGALEKAQKVLEELPIRDIVSWNAIISGYAEQGQFHEALKCYERMQTEGLSPDEVTFICILKACVSIRAIDKGKEIHEQIVNRGLLKKNIVLSNTLVDMYAKCGMLAKAQEVLEELPVRDVISWSTLISGYAQQGQAHEALDCFDHMQNEGLSPNVVTFISILQACGSIGAIDKGEQIHEEVVNGHFIETDIAIGNALVDMYAKCGMLLKAHEVLEKLPSRNVITWNALISGYAQMGQLEEALNCFKRMQHEDVSPDDVTFLCILTACGHSGLFYEAQVIFGDMIRKYNIRPNLEHHTCMVVVFGTSGDFDKAISMIKVMPCSDYPEIWLALLGACRKWGNVKLGRLAFDQVVQLSVNCSPAYVLMANIFVSAGMQEDANKVEDLRLKYASWKKLPGCFSVWVDSLGNAHSFSNGDALKYRQKDIYAKAGDANLKCSEEEIYPGLYGVSKDLQCGHTDKPAISYALINTQQGETIHIMNNAHICGDCHTAILLISKIEKRKIIIRDQTCLHVFLNGKYGYEE